MTVHLAANGFCEECESDRAWKNLDRQRVTALQKRRRVEYYENAKKYVDKKWKAKYGDEDIENVKMYKK